MVFVTSIISSQKWIRFRDAAAKQFPNEVLARGEIMRRYAMSGVAALKNLSEHDRARLQHEHQATMCVPAPEGDKGAHRGSDSAAGNGAIDAGAGTAYGTHGANPMARRETERGRGHPPSGSDAAVMGGERALDGGVGANQRLNWKAKKGPYLKTETTAPLWIRKNQVTSACVVAPVQVPAPRYPAAASRMVRGRSQRKVPRFAFA